MNRSADPTERHAGAARPGRGLRLAAGLAALLLVPGLTGGCSTVSGTISDVFGSGEAETESTVQTPPEAEGEQPFPNLGTVPSEAPETSTAAERAAIAEGLAADRRNAEYTDEPLTPAEPAAPAPAQPAVEAQPVPPPQPAAQPAAQPSQQVVQAAPSQQAPTPPAPTPPAPTPPAAPAAPAVQPEISSGGSVIVNPDAVLGGGPPATSRLLPSGESRPVALIFFRYGSAGLSRGDVNVLRDVAKLYKERGGLVRVIGHASQGPTARDVAKQSMANLNISLARANAVARELSRLGVPTDHIQVAAAGAQQPLYYETQPSGEAGNRRVEIYLDY